MTGNDIKDKADRYTSADITEDTIIDAIQDAFNWLGSKGYIIDTLLLEDIDADTFYSLPKDLVRIIKVEKPEENEYYYDYLIDGNMIRFGSEGTYRIFAERNPPMVNDMTTELPLHPMLANCVSNYAKGYAKVSIDDTSEDGHRLLQQFRQDAMLAYNTLKRNQSSPTQWKVIRNDG